MFVKFVTLLVISLVAVSIRETFVTGQVGAGIDGGGDNCKKWSCCSFQVVGKHARDWDIIGGVDNFVNGGKDSDSPTKALKFK